MRKKGGQVVAQFHKRARNRPALKIRNRNLNLKVKNTDENHFRRHLEIKNMPCPFLKRIQKI